MRNVAWALLTSWALTLALASCNSRPKYTCVAGPGEQCASDLWYADWQRLKAYQDKYKAPQEEQDRMVGLATRLQQQVPPGYDWDPKKERFVLKPVLSAPSAPQPVPGAGK